jgi:tetratricopeptide (TPR) repeat protein
VIELSPGADLGQYKLIKPLRQPLQSHSWLAETGAGEQVVLKLFEHGSSVPDSAGLEQLLQLNHPALDTSWSRFETGDWSGFARTYYTDLGHPGDQQFELDTLLALAIRLAEAMHVSHSAGLVHGRLQNSNLFSRGNRHLAITDPALITGNATALQDAAAEKSADLQVFGGILKSWTERLDDDHPVNSADAGGILLPPRFIWLLNALAEADETIVGEGFARVRDELDDIRLQWQRALKEGIPANWGEGKADYRPETSTAAVQPATRQKIMWQPTAIAAALLLFLVIAVWVLPAYFGVEESSEANLPPAAVSNATEETAEEATPPPTEEELAALLALREQAQAVLDDVINLRLQLESQEVTRWAEKAFNDAVALRDAGDEPYRSQDFAAAVEIYAEARDSLQLIVDQSRQVVQERLDSGNAALDRGDSAAAADTFGLALSIDPENADAQTGLKRAETLDEVLALLDEAGSLEEAGAWEEARENYRQISSLDRYAPGIDAEIERLGIAIAQRNFRSAMSDGLAALDAGDLPGARRAFNRARGMQPSAAGPAEGLQEVSRQERDLAVLQQREQAQALERSEDWTDALNQYQQLLKQDPNLKFAQEAVVRARDRANLDSELLRYLSQPSSWWSENGRKQAQSLLVEARAVNNPGPRLQQQKQQLELEIQRAGQQVPVQLQSDNLCNVVVYKVGRLGQFQSTELTLYPGYYTAVGVRDGYRDSRAEFLVQPEQEQAVTITCDEEI